MAIYNNKGSFPFNRSVPLRDVWRQTDRPFKSSKTQDFIKKDTKQTQFSNKEIMNDLGKEWKRILKTPGPHHYEINIGTLSLKFTSKYLLNSDSISRLTHMFVRLLAIHSLAEDKSRFKTYLTTTKGVPIIRYRKEVGEYTTNSNFLHLNAMIDNVIRGKKTMIQYVDEFKDLTEEYQIKKFINQYKSSLKWVKSIGCKNDDDLEILVNNLLDIYHVTFRNAEDEVKEAIVTNMMKTENTAPYKIQNKLTYHINTTYANLNFTTSQQDRIKDILVENFDWLGSCLRNCSLFPDDKKFSTWSSYHAFSISKTFTDQKDEIISELVETEYKSIIDDIFSGKDTVDEKIDDLKFIMSADSGKNQILKSFRSISRYIRHHKSIHPNFYPVMLKFERKLDRDLNHEEIQLLKFHSVVNSLPTNFFVKWRNHWQKPMLDDIENNPKNKLSLNDILYNRLVKPTVGPDGVEWSYFEQQLSSLVWAEYPKQKKWSAFSLFDKLLGEVSLKGISRDGLLNSIAGYQIVDEKKRTLEHFVAKRLKVDGTVSPIRFRGANMYYMNRPYNLSLGKLSVDEKLVRGLESDTTLGMIFGKCKIVRKEIKDIVDTKEWKDIFQKEDPHFNTLAMTTKEFISAVEVSSDNPIAKLRKEQLRLLIETLHKVQ